MKLFPNFYFTSILIIVLLAGIGSFLIYEFVRPSGIQSENNLSKVTPESGQSSNVTKSTGASTKIQEKIAPSGQVVEYTPGGFSPKVIEVKANKGNIDCLLGIFNKSPDSLLIRLSPHSLRDDYGFLYPEILPGETSIIDPRYRIPKIAFHNHQRPSEEFVVILGEGCNEF